MKAKSFSFLLLFFSVAKGSCPDGFTQAPNDGACYQINVYYNLWYEQYTPTTYDQGEAGCHYYNTGAHLASVHSEEENNFIAGLMDANSLCLYNQKNIGIQCRGLNCSWQDGSPVTYTNFVDYLAPVDDGYLRCYGLESYPENSKYLWREYDCKQPREADCWICKKPVECHDYETSYNGGCVSVYTWPLDQKSAEDACPIGGHLISIHGDNDNTHFMQLALAAGINGTIYLGGEFTNGIFHWLDGTEYDESASTSHWAKGFPNQVLGNCAQMLLDPTLGVQGLWTNVDCSIKQPYICYRSGFSSRAADTAPKANSLCPPIQNFTGSGSIYSPNYPQSIPSHQNCEYVLEAKEGSMASIIFHHFNCQQGTSLAIYDGINEEKPFILFTTNSPPPTQAYTATSNILKIIFTANEDDAVGTGWEAEFKGI